MIYVTAKDALRALKTFKRLAKQDLLASGHMAEPQFWRQQAKSRRSTYDVLMHLVKHEGVDAAHRYAVDALAALPLFRSSQRILPDGTDGGGVTAADKGKQQALHMFMSLLGDESVRLEASS